MLLCACFTLASLFFTFTIFRVNFVVLWNSIKELGLAFVAYFMYAFFRVLPEQSPITQPTEHPVIPPEAPPPNILPEQPYEFRSSAEEFLSLLFSSENLVNYLALLGLALEIFLPFLPLLLVFYFVLKFRIKSSFSKRNTRHNVDTIALKAFKSTSDIVYTPPKSYLVDLVKYIQTRTLFGLRLPFVWSMIWLFNLNIFAIVLSTFAIMIYFPVSLSLLALYNFFHNTLLLLLNIFRVVPPKLWFIPIIYILIRVGLSIDRWRKKVGISRLRHMENKNKGFINSLPPVVMVVGPPEAGKTTLVTDMGLSAEAIFRHTVDEQLFEISLEFPNFSFRLLERSIMNAIKSQEIYNMTSTEDWIDRQLFNYKKTLKLYYRCIRDAAKRGIKARVAKGYLKPYYKEAQKYIWNYDFDRYGTTYDNKLYVVDIVEAVKDYSKFFYFYLQELILSNFGVRKDARLRDIGNKPKWNNDFFERDSTLIHHMSERDSKGRVGISRYSKVFDYEMFRLGKKLTENPKFAGAYEGGVILLNEFDKERGNQFKNSDIKETIKQLRDSIKMLEKANADATAQKLELEQLTERATQLTDKLNHQLAFIRHACTVRNIPLVKVIVDMQRPEELGSGARDLFQIIHIREKSDTFLTMPFFFIYELIYSLIFPRYKKVQSEYDYNRGDNSLLMYLLKKVGATIHNGYRRIYNMFGYHVRLLAVENASTGKMLRESKYYLMTKKIYAKRFSTDAYGDIFKAQQRASRVGLSHLSEYKNLKASVKELQSQNSYFVNEVLKYNKES